MSGDASGQSAEVLAVASLTTSIMILKRLNEKGILQSAEIYDMFDKATLILEELGLTSTVQAAVHHLLSSLGDICSGRPAPDV